MNHVLKGRPRCFKYLGLAIKFNPVKNYLPEIPNPLPAQAWDHQVRKPIQVIKLSADS